MYEKIETSFRTHQNTPLQKENSILGERVYSKYEHSLTFCVRRYVVMATKTNDDNEVGTGDIHRVK